MLVRRADKSKVQRMVIEKFKRSHIHALIN